MLADDEVQLVDELNARDDEHPEGHVHLQAQGVQESNERVVAHEGQHEDEPHHGEQDQPLDVVPPGHPLPRQDVLFSRAPGMLAYRGGRLRRGHHGLPTVKDDMTVLMSAWYWL